MAAHTRALKNVQAVSGLNIDFSGGRSGGLVFPSLEEFPTVCGDPHSQRLCSKNINQEMRKEVRIFCLGEMLTNHQRKICSRTMNISHEDSD